MHSALHLVQVRKEVETCDLLSGFVLLQSMAGGTGAGLGTYVAQVAPPFRLSNPHNGAMRKFMLSALILGQRWSGFQPSAKGIRADSSWGNPIQVASIP